MGYKEEVKIKDSKDMSEYLCIICADVAVDEVKGCAYCVDCVEDVRK